MRMEADWEVEIGSDAPIIDASWPGFVNLSQVPGRADTLPEVASLPALSNALQQLNSRESSVWTVKCDVWPLPDPGEIDPYEMECDPEIANHAWACYIDILSRASRQWADPAVAVAFCKQLCAQLHLIPLSCCRADLIVRAAIQNSEALSPEVLDSEVLDHGITVYLTACGRTAQSARQTLETTLRTFTNALCPASAIE
jgi:hypothetical protein